MNAYKITVTDMKTGMKLTDTEANIVVAAASDEKTALEAVYIESSPLNVGATVLLLAKTLKEIIVTLPESVRKATLIEIYKMISEEPEPEENNEVCD